MASFTPLAGPNSFQGFRSMVSRQAPAASNLYWIRFRNPPEVFRKYSWAEGIDAFNNGITTGPGVDSARLLTYYATDVTVPSRQLTTGDAKTVGSMYRYVTGTTYSEISIQFILPRTMYTRMFFERWMNWASNDSTQKVSWYDEYVCPYLDIYKYERGGLTPAPTDWNSYSSVVSPGVGGAQPTLENYKANSIKFNRCSGVWTLKNAFPFNISNVNLNSGPSNLLSMEVSFYYERYRFYTPSNANIGDVNIPVTLGTTGSRNASTGIDAATALGPVGLSGATATVLASAVGSPSFIP